MDVLSKPGVVQAMREEFEAKSKEFPYVSQVGKDDLPRVPSQPRAK